MSDTATIRTKSIMGIQIQNPISYGLGFTTIEMPSRTQAEVRRDKLRWKLKVRIAWRNGILFGLCYLVSIALVTSGIIGLIILIQPSSGVGPIMGMCLGIILAEIYLILWYVILQWFETNPNYIHLRR